MRFRVQVIIDIDAPDLAVAQALDDRIGRAAYAAARAAAVRGDGGAFWRTELTPGDEAAGQAFRDEGIGPGISSGGFSTELP